jgi:hypothetical protein
MIIPVLQKGNIGHPQHTWSANVDYLTISLFRSFKNLRSMSLGMNPTMASGSPFDGFESEREPDFRRIQVRELIRVVLHALHGLVAKRIVCFSSPIHSRCHIHICTLVELRGGLSAS